MEITKRHHPTVPGYPAVQQSRALKDGKLNFLWQMSTNNMQGGPNINDEIFPGWRNPENFIVVSDPYPSVSAVAADLILPTCMWVEKKGVMVTLNVVPNYGVNK